MSGSSKQGCKAKSSRKSPIMAGMHPGIKQKIISKGI